MHSSRALCAAPKSHESCILHPLLARRPSPTRAVQFCQLISFFPKSLLAVLFPTSARFQRAPSKRGRASQPRSELTGGSSRKRAIGCGDSDRRRCGRLKEGLPGLRAGAAPAGEDGSPGAGKVALLVPRERAMLRPAGGPSPRARTATTVPATPMTPTPTTTPRARVKGTRATSSIDCSRGFNPSRRRSTWS